MAAFAGAGHAPCEEDDMLEFSPPPSVWVELKVSSPSLVPSPARHLPLAQQWLRINAIPRFDRVARTRKQMRCTPVQKPREAMALSWALVGRRQLGIYLTAPLGSQEKMERVEVPEAMNILGQARVFPSAQLCLLVGDSTRSRAQYTHSSCRVETASPPTRPANQRPPEKTLSGELAFCRPLADQPPRQHLGGVPRG